MVQMSKRPSNRCELQGLWALRDGPAESPKPVWLCHSPVMRPSLLVLASMCAYAQISVTASRVSDQPVLEPGPAWTSTGIFNPTAVERDGKIVLLFRATDAKMVSRIGYAESSDGLHFKIREDPVLSPSAPYEAGGGVEDPRVVFIDGIYSETITNLPPTPGNVYSVTIGGTMAKASFDSSRRVRRSWRRFTPSTYSISR